MILSCTLKPFLQHYYLKSRRPFRYKGLILAVEPGVFHPGLFFSSKILAKFITQFNLTNKHLLDMGCGSGLLSLVAAEQGAKVVSADLNDLALDNTRTNAQSNGLDLTIVKSDIFNNITEQFDYILVNPPYYPRKAKDAAGLAWYCGENFEYFRAFFNELSKHINQTSQVYMILSDGCALNTIGDIANEHQFKMFIVHEQEGSLESSFIFRIERM